MILAHLAFRSVLRQRRRSLLTVAVLATGFLALALAGGFAQQTFQGLAEGAIRGGQREVPVHIFPFRMTQSNIESETKGGFFSRGDHAQWADFWRNLKEGHDIFEQTREPPQAYACAGRYAFNGAGRACSRIAGW